MVFFLVFILFTWIVSILFSFNSSSESTFRLKISIYFEYPKVDVEEEEYWCPLYEFDSEFSLIKLTDGDTTHGKSIANEILWASFSFFPLLIWFYKTHRSTRNPVLQVEEWWWQNTAVNSLQWEKDSLYVVYNFNAAYSESRECDRWWWRGRAACISYAVLALFSHENLYILSVHTWTGYWTATERLNCCDSPFGDGL